MWCVHNIIQCFIVLCLFSTHISIYTKIYTFIWSTIICARAPNHYFCAWINFMAEFVHLLEWKCARPMEHIPSACVYYNKLTFGNHFNIYKYVYINRIITNLYTFYTTKLYMVWRVYTEPIAEINLFVIHLVSWKREYCDAQD